MGETKDNEKRDLEVLFKRSVGLRNNGNYYDDSVGVSLLESMKRSIYRWRRGMNGGRTNEMK